jgi:hypothetical protein
VEVKGEDVIVSGRKKERLVRKGGRKTNETFVVIGGGT